MRIKLCDGTETYLLENEALQLGGNYSVLQEIPIANSSQTFMLSTSINGMDLGDLFSLNLHYNEGNGSLGAQAQKNGNIAWMKWQVAGRDQQAYGFQYDELDRLTQAKYADISNTGAYATENQYGVYGISYDKNGNLNNLNRYGLNPNSGSNCQINIDQLSYTYFPNSNRLQNVADAAPTATRAQGFNPNGKSGDFAYDDNGNLTQDPYKDLTIGYNFLNLPDVVSKASGGQLSIAYDAAGVKLRKTVVDGSNSYTQDYVGGIEYKEQKMEAIYNEEGRLLAVDLDNNGTRDLFRFEWVIRDHLS